MKSGLISALTAFAALSVKCNSVSANIQRKNMANTFQLYMASAAYWRYTYNLYGLESQTTE